MPSRHVMLRGSGKYTALVVLLAFLSDCLIFAYLAFSHQSYQHMFAANGQFTNMLAQNANAPAPVVW